MKNTLLAAMQTSLFKETMDYQKQLQTPPAKIKKPKINTTKSITKNSVKKKRASKKKNPGVHTKSASKHWILGHFKSFNFDHNKLPQRYHILLRFLCKKDLTCKHTLQWEDKRKILSAIAEEVFEIWTKFKIPVIHKDTVYSRVKCYVLKFLRFCHMNHGYRKNDINWINKTKKSYDILFDIAKCKHYSQIIYKENSTVKLSNDDDETMQVCKIKTGELEEIVHCDCPFEKRFPTENIIKFYLSQKIFSEKKEIILLQNNISTNSEEETMNADEKKVDIENETPNAPIIYVNTEKINHVIEHDVTNDESEQEFNQNTSIHIKSEREDLLNETFEDVVIKDELANDQILEKTEEILHVTVNHDDIIVKQEIKEEDPLNIEQF